MSEHGVFEFLGIQLVIAVSIPYSPARCQFLELLSRCHDHGIGDGAALVVRNPIGQGEEFRQIHPVVVIGVNDFKIPTQSFFGLASFRCELGLSQ